MSEPFIFIGSYRVKPDFLEVAPQRLRDVTALVEEQEPQLRSFHFYLDEDRGRAICVQVHPDAESMATHMAVIANHLATAWDWLDLDSSVQQVLGTPPKVLTEVRARVQRGTGQLPDFRRRLHSHRCAGRRYRLIRRGHRVVATGQAARGSRS